jgi:hypothetical protein
VPRQHDEQRHRRARRRCRNRRKTLPAEHGDREEFLSCLSKAAIEKAAADEGVKIGSRGKDTRANLIERFKDGIYIYPSALFAPTPDEIAEAGRHTRSCVENSGEGEASAGEGEGTGGNLDERPDGDSDTDQWPGPDEGQLPAAAK